MNEIVIKLGPVVGSGTPPQWFFSVEHEGRFVAQATGPRVLILEMLGRWVELLEEESRPT